MRVRLVAAAMTAVVVALAGCSAVQDQHECPGATCTRTLQAVADDVGDVEGVRVVDVVRWSSGLDDGVRGRIEVQAEVADARAAREVAREAADRYRSGDLEEVDGLTVVVRAVAVDAVDGGAAYCCRIRRTAEYEFVDSVPLGSGLREVR